MIEIDGVRLFYDKKIALDGVQARIEEGHICGMVGPNGAGKTTLLRCCLGLLREFNGRITIDGRDVKKERAWVKQHCTYAPEDLHLFPYLSAEEILHLVGRLRGLNEQQVKDQSAMLYDILEMHSFCRTLTCDYSHGMKQKTLLATALIGNPDYVFIDEALNGLDTIALFQLKEYLQNYRQTGATILIASHVVPLLADWCDSMLVLSQGRIHAHWTKAQITALCEQEQASLEKIMYRIFKGDEK